MPRINEREVAIQRYWMASSAFNARIPNKGWTMGKLINELSSLAHFEGQLGKSAAATLTVVIEEGQPPSAKHA